MSKLSFLIPSRGEKFLVPTVKTILENCSPEVEIVICLDGGEWPNPEPLPDRENVVVIRHTESRGTRAAINACAAVASGSHFCKLDAHTIVSPGFDQAVIAECAGNTVVVPLRKRLDAEAWAIEETSRPDVAYEFLSWHPTDLGGWTHNIKQWDEKNRDESLREKLVDETMCMQASCWCVSRETYSYLDLMDEQTYGPLMNEGEELALKCWTSGGRVLVDKRVWYGHLFKGKRYGRGYEMNMDHVRQGAVGVRKWLTDSAWPGGKQTLPFSWLIEKFNPPGWPPELRADFARAIRAANNQLEKPLKHPLVYMDPVVLRQLDALESPFEVRQELLSNPALIITKAEYGSDKRKADVTDIMRKIVADQEGKRLSFCTGKDFDLLFGNPARGRQKRLSVWCTLGSQPYFFLLGHDKPGKVEKTNERPALVSDGYGSAGSSLPAIHDLDQSSAGAGELPGPGLLAGDRGVSPDIVSEPNTLERILGKFNLDLTADYSKVSMPLALNLNRRQIAELFYELGFKTGVEIGTAEGEYAEVLCKANPELRLYCVDPYLAYQGYSDHRNQRKLDDYLIAAQTRLDGYNAVIYRKESQEFAKNFREELDFVYIDANHSFEHVVADIAAWLPKIRSGGICAGHDYSNPKGKGFGVIQAVRGWTEAYGITPWFVLKGTYEAVGDRSHSWLWVKP